MITIAPSNFTAITNNAQKMCIVALPAITNNAQKYSVSARVSQIVNGTCNIGKSKRKDSDDPKCTNRGYHSNSLIFYCI
ncbi:hypothetical protein L1887_21121 [Cichorium endivia]|nr:hypothetical protein L1887_21121 [Cichorium endivia]